MKTDLEDQEDELLALQSIFTADEFARNESKCAGEIRVSAELPAGFTVAMKEGEVLCPYQISFLPPLLLNFDLPEDYPSSSPPSFALTCSWLTHTQLHALSAQLSDLYQATGGAVVLFTWTQFIKEDTLTFLGIDSLLELLSNEHGTQSSGQAAHQEQEENTLDSGTAAHQTCYVSNLGEADVPTPSYTSERETPVARDEVALLPSTSSGPVAEHRSAPLSSLTQRGSPANEGHSAPPLTPSQRLLSQILVYDAAQQQKQFASTVFECSVCFMGCLGSDCVKLHECGHIFCQTCLAEFCKVQITEGNVRGVTCPQADCSAAPTPAQVRSLVGDDLFSRYDRLLLQNTLDSMPDVVYCPRPSCGSAVIRERSGNAAMCSVCGFAFCVSCRKTYHGTDECQGQTHISEQTENNGDLQLPRSKEGLVALWEDYATGSKERQRLLERRYGRTALTETLENFLSAGWITVNSKSCPHCFSKIEKDGGCNVMTCSRCCRRFCWICLKKLFHADAHFHGSPCAIYMD